MSPDLLKLGVAWVVALEAFEEFERDHPNDATARWDRVFEAKCTTQEELREAIEALRKLGD